MISLKKILLKLIKPDEWHLLDMTDSKFSFYTGDSYDNTVVYRKEQNMVQIYGALKAKTTLAAGDALNLIGTLPEGYRPQQEIALPMQGTNYHMWLLRIEPDGKVYESRYGYAGEYKECATTRWLPFSVMFMI